jgi:hypothetical protein
LNLEAKPPREPEPALVARHEEPKSNDDDSAWYGKWWVWTLVGAAVAGGVVAGVASSQSPSSGTQPGSLGLLDGRR